MNGEVDADMLRAYNLMCNAQRQDALTKQITKLEAARSRYPLWNLRSWYRRYLIRKKISEAVERRFGLSMGRSALIFPDTPEPTFELSYADGTPR